MPASDRHQQPLRLPRDVAARLRRQAERRKISVNTYVQLALEEKLETDEAHQQQRADQRRSRDRDREAPRGLGLRLSRRVEPEPLLALAEAPPPVVVNVGTKDGADLGDGSLIGGLAAYILGGPTFSQGQRKRLAVEVLRAHGKSPGEREGLTQKLDQVLGEQEKQRPARALGGAIGSLFR